MERLLEIKEFGFDKNTLFKQTSLNFSLSEKISISGKNGVGKSTLLDLISNKISNNYLNKPLEQIAYYGKHAELDLNVSFENLIWQWQEILNDSILRRTIDGLNFGNQIKKRLGKLSKGNYAKAKLIFLLSMGETKFLLLDEPTENIDAESVDFLVEMLKARNLGYLIVSHSQSFLHETCDRHLYIENSKINEYNI